MAKQQDEQEFPVYLFTGFLESGKTKFIKETLADPKFNAGEKTLLVVCGRGDRRSTRKTSLTWKM